MGRIRPDETNSILFITVQLPVAAITYQSLLFRRSKTKEQGAKKEVEERSNEVSEWVSSRLSRTYVAISRWKAEISESLRKASIVTSILLSISSLTPYDLAFASCNFMNLESTHFLVQFVVLRSDVWIEITMWWMICQAFRRISKLDRSVIQSSVKPSLFSRL